MPIPCAQRGGTNTGPTALSRRSTRSPVRQRRGGHVLERHVAAEPGADGGRTGVGYENKPRTGYLTCGFRFEARWPVGGERLDQPR